MQTSKTQVYYNTEEYWVTYSDGEDGFDDKVLLAFSITKRKAIVQAINELNKHINQLKEMLNEE